MSRERASQILRLISTRGGVKEKSCDKFLNMLTYPEKRRNPLVEPDSRR